MKSTKTKQRHENPARVFVVIDREVADHKEKARILDLLDDAALTYALGVEAAEAGIRLGEWPYRCVSAWEFKRGFLSAATLVARDDLMVREDGAIINKNVN